MADYDFRKKITVNHEKIDTVNQTLSKNELKIPKNISIDKEFGVVSATAIEDFKDFLFVAFDIKVDDAPKKFIKLKYDGDMDNSPICFRIEVENDIIILAKNDKSFAQAFYYLEFCLKERRFNSIKKGCETKSMEFSPRMVHSGMGLAQYPNEYLSTVAHYGYDAILLFAKGVNKVTSGDLDFNDLCDRAEKYGIDVYAYCYKNSFTNPRDKGTEELYEKMYGEIFRFCPKIKGMVFVGESVEFLSEDENVVKHRYNEYPKEGIPENKPSPGWWPCKDYSIWITKVRDAIRKYKKNADIVFWTYNWGWAPQDARIKLIQSLPEDISLLVTFEMFQNYRIYNTVEKVSDYSLTVPTSGDYFNSEAKIAKEKGIRLYTMCNTAGRTWDFGGAPYLPMPYQWIERIKSINLAKKNYNLSGLMEGHHYGFYPNFISRLAYLSFMDEDYEKNLDRVLKAEFNCNSERLKVGLKYASESIKYLAPTIEEQYGPFRAGTTYPLCLIKGVQPIDYPDVHGGNRYWSPLYGQFENGLKLGFGDNGLPYCYREKAELKMIKKSISLFKKAIDTIEREDGETDLLVNLLKYLKCCVVTVQNTKLFYHEKVLLRTYKTKFQIKKITGNIRSIAEREIDNAIESKIYLEKDSSLGYEPAMMYVNNCERVEWKIKQVKYMLENELSYYEKGLKK